MPWFRDQQLCHLLTMWVENDGINEFATPSCQPQGDRLKVADSGREHPLYAQMAEWQTHTAENRSHGNVGESSNLSLSTNIADWRSGHLARLIIWRLIGSNPISAIS